VYLPGWLEGSQPRGAKRHHITAKPVELLAELVRACPVGGLVLDPFAGSGSAGVAALSTGRRYLGIEITKHYAAVAVERIRETEECPPRTVSTSPNLLDL
jgi:site-specific DNA-methyltransferase (adenine-specific)